MSIDTPPDGSLRIREHFWLARSGLLAFTGLVATGVAYAWLGGVEIFHPAWGWLIGAATSLGFAALFEDVDMEFNRPERRVRWQKRRMFSKKSGDIPMEAVQDITLGIAGVDDSSRWPRYRLVMVTNEATVPLSNMHTTDKSELEQTAKTLLAVLQRTPTGDIVDRSLNAAVAQGRTLEAVHWLRLRDGLDLTRARKVIDEMRRKE